MKKYTGISLLLLLLALGCEPQDRPKYVVVIGLDGTSPDGIMYARTPTLDSLRLQGTSTMQGRAVRKSVSSPNWASIMMGAEPSQHGITSNQWERYNYQIEPAATGMEDIFPTIFSVIKTQKPDLKTAAVYEWTGFGRLFEKSAVDFDYNPAGPDETAAKVVELFKTEQPAFTFIHLVLVDKTGHHDGHGTPEYYASVEKADSLVGQILNGLKIASMMDDAVVIVTADHGGVGYGHGGDSMDEMTIPFIIAGKGIRQGVEITGTYYTFDNAATVAHLFGLKIPQAWTGRPALAAFSSTDKAYLSEYSRPLVFPVQFSQKGGRFVQDTIRLSLKAKAENVIRYTTDGSEPDRSSTIYADPLELSTATTIKARAFSTTSESITNKADFEIYTPNNGIHWAYYEGEKWTVLPPFSQLTPKKTGISFDLSLEAVPDRPEDHYAIQFTTWLEIKKADDYTFILRSDDGSRLTIDNQVVVDNDGSHSVTEKSGTIALPVGRVRLQLDYFEDYDSEELTVFWQSSNSKRQKIPATLFFKSAQ